MSCLFDSVAYYIHNRTSLQIRQEVCSYYASDPMPFFDTFSFQETFSMTPPNDRFSCQNVAQYISMMGQSTTWGGALELKAIANLYHVRILVHTRSLSVNSHHRHPPIEFLPINNETPRDTLPVISLFYTGNHFTPLASV